MKILMIGAADPISTGLAGLLAHAGHDVLLLYSGELNTEGGYESAALTDHGTLLPAQRQFDQALYLASASLPCQLLPQLLKECAGAIPAICAEPRSILTQADVPLSPCHAVCKAMADQVRYLSVPAVYGDSFLPEELMIQFLMRTRTNRLTLRGGEENRFDALHLDDLAALLLNLLARETGRELWIGSGYASSMKQLCSCISAKLKISKLTLSGKEPEHALISGDSIPDWMPTHSMLQ